LIDYVAMDIKLPKERYAMVFAGADRGSTPADLTGVQPLSIKVDDIEESINDFEKRRR